MANFLSYADWKAQQTAGQAAQDSGGAKRPYLNYNDWKAEQAKPVADETIEAVQPRQNQTVSDSDTQPAPAQAPNPKFAGIEPMQATTPQGGRDEGSIESTEELADFGQGMADFGRDELLPSVGGAVGAMAAGAALTASAPVSIPMLILGTAAGAWVGGSAGEFAEQQLKAADVFDKPTMEANIRTQQDILEHSFWRGGEEALWSLVPDAVMAGSKYALNKIGGSATVDEVKTIPTAYHGKVVW